MQSELREISGLVEAVFRAWRGANIPFLVLRNYQALPAHTGNDIDVLVKATDRRRAEQTLLNAARAAGFKLHNRAEFATLAIYLTNLETLTQVHFDLFTALKWRGFDYLDCEGFLERRIERDSFAIPHPADEAATNLLAEMIFSGAIKDKYKSSIASGFADNRDACAKLLARTYGTTRASQIAEAAGSGRWSEIESRTGELRRTLILRQLICRPLRTARSLFADALRLTKRLVRPPGRVIVLCGADGCGKSTVGKALIEELSATFSPRKGRYFHWKPPLFSQRRRAERGPVAAPHAEPARNPVISLAYFAAHWLEFFLGSIMRVSSVTFRNGLVLIDRYYYDFFADQRRYRLRVPRWLVRLGYALLPKPDLVFLLDAPAEVLQSRKSEVPMNETRRQCEAYLEVVGGLNNGVVINANQPPEKVVRDIAGHVLRYMAEKAAC